MILLLAGICGSASSLIAVIAYITIGLLYLPVFTGGGSVGYLATPDFGYLAGFVPAVWFTGAKLTYKNRNSLYQIFVAILMGLTIIHSVGIINLFIGTITNRWEDSFSELLIIYSISTFPFQLLLCPTITIVIRFMRSFILNHDI